jgi:hypothetical protein
MSHADFSSWPREQEASFVVYERRTSESAKSAITIGSICGAIVFVIAIGIYAGVEPDKSDNTKDMNMSNLTKDSKATAPTPDPPKAEAKQPEAPKEEAKPAETKTDTPAEKPADDKK